MEAHDFGEKETKKQKREREREWRRSESSTKARILGALEGIFDR